jgi:hypothetical protein
VHTLRFKFVDGFKEKYVDDFNACMMRVQVAANHLSNYFVHALKNVLGERFISRSTARSNGLVVSSSNLLLVYIILLCLMDL